MAKENLTFEIGVELQNILHSSNCNKPSNPYQPILHTTYYMILHSYTGGEKTLCTTQLATLPRLSMLVKIESHASTTSRTTSKSRFSLQHVEMDSAFRDAFHDSLCELQYHHTEVDSTYRRIGLL